MNSFSHPITAPAPAEETLEQAFRPKYNVFQLQKRARRAIRRSALLRRFLARPGKSKPHILAAAQRALNAQSIILANVEHHCRVRNIPLAGEPAPVPHRDATPHAKRYGGY